jgi:tellurite resistance protein
VFVLTIITGGLYLYFYLKSRQRARAMCSPVCAPPQRAISYLGWHGTVHQFEVASATFASAFLASNAKKVVEADSTARALLEAPRPTAPAKPLVASPKPVAQRAEQPRVGRARDAALPPPIVVSRGAPPPVPSRAAAVSGFYGPSSSVTVSGRTLQGPLAYVMRDATKADASSIVTSLRVGNAFSAEPLPYWPTYSTATPAQRAVYLDWLASDRSDPEVPIGYVFIHFYGLERRVLVDGADHEIVHAELKRLLSIYGGVKQSFRGYASSLLAFSTLPALPNLSEFSVYAKLAEVAPDDPTALSGLLAWFHINERPLPTSCAMLVAGSMEDAKRGAVVQRARAELDDLFAIRYRERFGSGIRVEASKRPEVIEYHPASPTLLAAARQIRVSIPHVLGRPAQFAPLVALWNECVVDLKKLSFARREHADAPLTGEAWMALPPELRADYDHPDHDAWDDAVQSAPRLGAFRLISAGRLAALARIEVDERVTGARLRRAVETAACLGYAIEPDARIVAKTVAASSEMAIWRSTASAAPDATLWKSVHTMLSLTLSVALSDGEIADEEGQTVDGLIEDLFALDETMRTRVAALRAILTRQPARATTVAKKLKESRTPSELTKIGRVLVAVAAVDGVIVDGEHKSLKSLYKAMGLPPSELAAAIVASGARLGTDAAVSVRAARLGPAGESIPPPPEAQPGALNAPAIAAILAETREVALLLAEVLDDEDDDIKPVAAALRVASAPKASAVVADSVSQSSGEWASLDARYHDVLRELLTRPSWSVSEVRLLATRSKLMPGAILEALNTWSDERFGDYVIEEAGDWQIHARVLERKTA